jgi:dipeptidyl-peptidase-4
MFKKILSLSFIIACVSFSFAQKKNLSMEDAMLNARTTLAPENLKFIQFVKGTGDYVYLKKDSIGERWVRGSFSGKGTADFLTLSEINRRMRLASLDTLTAMPSMQFAAAEYTVNVKGQKIVFNTGADGFRIVVNKEIAGKSNVEEGPAGYIAYLDSFNLFVAGSKGSVKVTSDGSKDIVYASSVHRDEFGITKGTFWSNTGNRLAYYRMDQSMVSDYPVIDWTTRPAVAENIKYPMAGDKSHEVTLWIYDALHDKNIKVRTEGPSEQYLTNIAWSPDDKYIFIAVLNREQNHMWLNQYDAASGAFVKTLFEETQDKYVEPLVPVLFVKGNSNQFIWQSRRDGWTHLYLYDMEGKMIRQLTSGKWEVIDVKGFDEKGENLFFVSNQASPVSRNLYRLNMKSGRVDAVTTGDNVHNTQVSTSGDCVIDISSSISNPRTIELIRLKDGKHNILLQAADPLDGYNKGKLSLFTIKNEEGTDLYCRMYQPVNFDSSKKYPVIVYWYGGPHNQLITNSWNGGSGDYWFQYLAENGYLVFSLDVRGSSYRGRDFEQSIFRSVGKKQMADLMAGVNYLKSLRYVNAARMGLFGWSFGGFLTTNMMLTNPRIFKAAVAGGPVMNWQYYEIMYTERYMDRPQENSDGYKETDLISRAGELKGKLLLIHGLQDPVVVQQHSVNFVRSAISKNVQVDYMIYPGHEHNVLGKDRAHLYQKVTDYFFQNLK